MKMTKNKWNESGVGDIAISRPFISSQPGHQTQPSLPERLANRLYTPKRAKQQERPYRYGNVPISIVCCSDTHNAQPSLPPGDILLHAGDLSQYGTFDEIQAQLDWLSKQPHRHKVVIAGNHDLLLDETFVSTHPDRELDKPGKSRKDLRWGSILYLQDSSCTVEFAGRVLTIYGNPWTPKCGNFAFQYGQGEDFWRDKIPEIDILLTHGPPAAHLDEGKGCTSLLREIWRKKPKLVVFGHIHGAHGEEVLCFDSNQAHYENIILEQQRWINLFHLVFKLVSRFLAKSGPTAHSVQSTWVVNAAVGGASRSTREMEPFKILF